MTAEASTPRRDRIALALLAALFLLAYFPTLRWLVHRWSMGVWYHTHGFVVPLVSGWLAFVALRAIRDRPPAPSAWGYAFAVPALLFVTVPLSFLSVFISVFLIQRQRNGDRRRSALWKALLLGVLAAIPTSITGTPIGLALLAWAGIKHPWRR